MQAEASEGTDTEVWTAETRAVDNPEHRQFCELRLFPVPRQLCLVLGRLHPLQGKPSPSSPWVQLLHDQFSRSWALSTLFHYIVCMF